MSSATFKPFKIPMLSTEDQWFDIGDRRIVQIGFGAIGGAMLELYRRHIKMDNPNQVIVFDMDASKIPDNKMGAQFFNVKITRSNYKKELGKYLRKGDILVDLAWYIDTLSLLELCNKTEAFFVNAAVENWPDHIDQVDPQYNASKYSLYARQEAIQSAKKKWRNNPTAIITHGANPGWVSHAAKLGMIEWVQWLQENQPSAECLPTCLKLIKQIQTITPSKTSQKDREEIRKLWAQLSQALQIQVIHVSEHDTLVSNIPKRKDEFVCTWSPMGFIEEGIAPAELGWGTHETMDESDGVVFHNGGVKNQVCLSSRGINTLCHTFVPSGSYVGMVVRHEEASSIASYLTVGTDKKPVYCPTVHYAYKPCFDAIASMYELQSNNYAEPKATRLIRGDAIEGKGELGCFMLSKKYGAWWIGTVQSVADCRKYGLHDESPTVLCVATGVLGAMKYCFAHPNMGVIHPDSMNCVEAMSSMVPYMQPFVSGHVANWKPRINARFDTYGKFGIKKNTDSDDWTFNRLRVKI
jgi:homospermidine synthase